LLVFGDEILHVGFGLGEFHLVHTFLGVPVKESLALEHGRELVGDTLEEFLDSGRVADEGNSHLETTRSNVALSSEHVAWDPFDEVGRVLLLDVVHLFLDLLHGHLSAEHSSDGEVATVSWVRGSHHVLGVEHLLSQLGDSNSAILLAATSSQRSKANHEEVETREGDQVDSHLAQIRVELTWELETLLDTSFPLLELCIYPQACGDTRHDNGDEVVKIAIGGGGQLEGTEADLIQSLVINAESLVRVLNELVDRESSVVWLNDGVGYLETCQKRIRTRG
jgi:hypothetical protein